MKKKFNVYWIAKLADGVPDELVDGPFATRVAALDWFDSVGLNVARDCRVVSSTINARYPIID